MNVYVGGWSLKPETDNQVSTPLVGSLHDGVLDLRFEPHAPQLLDRQGPGPYRCQARLSVGPGATSP